MLRSLPTIWLVISMYALSAPMCCCQLAEVTGALGKAAQSLLTEPISSDAQGSTCCSKCATRQQAASQQKHPAPAPDSCQDCDQCLASALTQNASPTKSLEAFGGPWLCEFASVAADRAGFDQEHVRGLLHLRHPAMERESDTSRGTLFDLHCALLV